MPLRTFESKWPRTAAGVYIDPSAVVIGDVCLGQDVSLWPQVVARGDVNSIVLGARTNIQDGGVLHVTSPGPFARDGHALRVGCNVTVGHRVILHGCTVGDYCLIGMGSLVLDGAVLEPRVMLGAGCLVPPGKRLEGGFLYLGSPARRARALSDEELKLLEYSAAHYVRVKERHLRSG